MNAQYYFGLPERPNDMLLQDTVGKDPFKLLNIDHYRPQHELFTPQNLYVNIPYITGHTADLDASILWVNPSETWVDLEPST